MNKSKTIQSYFMKVGGQQNRDTPEKGLDLKGVRVRKQKSKEYETKENRA